MNLNDEGYLVVDALTAEQAQELAKELTNYLLTIIFADSQVDLNLLTDRKLRTNAFGYPADELVWEQANSRRPIYSKSTGMFHGHYNLKKLSMIDFNPQLYQIASQVMGSEQLVFRAGIERFSIKPGKPNSNVEGASDMPLHLDANPHCSNVNYPFRIQALVCLSADTNIAARDSGCLRVLANFHHYWNFIGMITHPVDGIVNMGKGKDRFFSLPNNFEQELVPLLNDHIKAYTLYCHQQAKYMQIYERNFELEACYERILKAGVTVPIQIKLLNWRILNVKPGQMVFWHQYLPHQSLRNKSKVPRIVSYYGLFPVTKEYYHTAEHFWLLDMVSKASFYYGLNNGEYPYIVKNKQELAYLQQQDQLAEVVHYIANDPLARKLVGLDKWF